MSEHVLIVLTSSHTHTLVLMDIFQVSLCLLVAGLVLMSDW